MNITENTDKIFVIPCLTVFDNSFAPIGSIQSLSLCMEDKIGSFTRAVIDMNGFLEDARRELIIVSSLRQCHKVEVKWNDGYSEDVYTEYIPLLNQYGDYLGAINYILKVKLKGVFEIGGSKVHVINNRLIFDGEFEFDILDYRCEKVGDGI